MSMIEELKELLKKDRKDREADMDWQPSYLRVLFCDEYLKKIEELEAQHKE